MNNNNVNTNTEGISATSSSELQPSEFGINTSNIVNSPEVHGHIATHSTPLAQEPLDNISITIEENSTGRINNLEFANETNSTENIMGQYARYLRRQVAEVTRGRLGNIVASSSNNDLSNPFVSADTPMPSDNLNRIRPIATSFGGLNRILTPEVLQTFTSTDNFNASTRHSNNAHSLNNQVMITLSHHDTEAASRIVPMRMIAARTPLLSSSQELLNSQSYFPDNTNSNDNANQTIISRSRLLDNGHISLIERTSNATTSAGSNGSADNSIRGTEETATSTNELYNSVYPDILITTLRQFLHYIPFVCILLVKFIYDYLSFLLDIILLQFVMYYVNKSLQAQVTRIDEKKNSILLRDLFLVVSTVSLRLLAASTPPDPFGMLIAPSFDERSIVHQIAFNFPQDTSGAPAQNEISTTTAQASLERTVVIPKLISLVALLYYIAVNDIILKLITIAVKLIITLIPLRAIRHKSRTRLYVFTEFFSQFFRSLVPIRQWLLFFFESYSGLHAIIGVMFSSAYIVLKGCQLADCGKSLKKSFLNILKDVDKARKPVRDDFDAADELCAICQDSYVSPVVLECGHIFCDNCVTTWFKREQTCPMCRAKVGDNLAWHDGSTTFFYQLY